MKVISSSVQLIEGYGPFGHMNLKALDLVLFVLPVGWKSKEKLLVRGESIHGKIILQELNRVRVI